MNIAAWTLLNYGIEPIADEIYPIIWGWGWTPANLFAASEVGAWLDINDFTLLYTTYNGSTNVSAVNDAIGRAERKAGTLNALNATSTQRPLLKQWPSAGRYHAYHDRVDDKLTLASMPAGTYTIGAATFAGVQIYTHVHNTTGTLNVPGSDYTEIVVVNRALTSDERTALQSYLATKAPTIGAADVLRLYSYTNSVSLSITESGGSSGATWELGDGQTASGTSCVKTVAAPQFVILRATDKTKIYQISWATRSLFGQIVDLSGLTALTTFNCSNNQLTGSIPPLSANTALANFYCDTNQLTGSIPPLSANTALSQFYCYSNQLTGWDGGTVSATLGNFQANNNLLPAATVNALLAAFVAANRTTGTRLLSLGGTGNEAPTGQGITDKATLVSRGWTVTTN